MYDELIKDLREYGDIWRDKLLYEAADAIEELQKQLQKSEVDNINLTGWLAEEHAKQCPHFIHNVHDRGDDSLCDKWMCEIKSLPKWIPVTERLPDENDVVLFTDSLDVGTGYLVHGYGWISPFDDIDTSHVSHWMPLPEPPESEG